MRWCLFTAQGTHKEFKGVVLILLAFECPQILVRICPMKLLTKMGFGFHSLFFKPLLSLSPVLQQRIAVLGCVAQKWLSTLRAVWALECWEITDTHGVRLCQLWMIENQPADKDFWKQNKLPNAKEGLIVKGRELGWKGWLPLDYLFCRVRF